MMKRIIVALDFPSAEQALGFVKKLDPDECRLKVGFELYVAAGPDLVRKLVDSGFDVFLDLKFHDIPNTVASACKAAAELGVWMMNVHASGGSVMMNAAAEAVSRVSQPPLLIAVTVLTSMDQQQMSGIGLDAPVSDQVMRLASLTKKSGLDGVVCSAQEASILRSALGDAFDLVTPGIRSLGSCSNDQSRIVTPRQALEDGSSYLVIGRPITRAEDPVSVLRDINVDIQKAG
ncbi:MAG: Orotidine 5'-phosphate decarboxylase (EC [uncultured Thiotrichaceae bacterium]|uniref:Orotidine 5'-phosphate decarboxylase n=1 Tax=uncultured Thiotrichaceae bacterium TaxID=298394 RepID=A0A6S6UG25_9GAMM|nr:MAG: Orotidine 5'-phosphate decarboxylase (EC [uncultured Thiotrichaceae bacterium]